MFKKIILAAAIVGFSSGAFAAATAICGALTAAGAGTAIAAGSDFVKSPFTPKCSPNVHLAKDENSTTFAVSAGSAKGKTYFSANTNGGGVAADGTCPTSGCTSADTQSKVTTKLSASS